MQWHLGPFRLDLANACLWHATQPVTLRPKTFQILVYLVTHAGQLVTKESLLDAIWLRDGRGRWRAEDQHERVGGRRWGRPRKRRSGLPQCIGGVIALSRP